MYKTSKSKLRKEMEKLSKGSVLVLGDLILDEFVQGCPERISREAPVLILEFIESHYALGGASNAANNITALNAKSIMVGVVGNDTYAQDLKKECIKRSVITALIQDSSRPTTVKTRISSMAHKHPTNSVLSKQQVLRVDRLSKRIISHKIEKQIILTLKKHIKGVKTVLISDYDLGICSNYVIKETIKLANEKKIPVIVDAQSNLKRFSGVYLFTPNQPDTEAEVGFSITNHSTLLKAGIKLLEATKANNILITRGSEGMALFKKSNPEKPFLLPAFNLSEVFDVTGAGDTVAGTISTAISVGIPIEDACIIGNLAASLVVRKYGTVTTNKKELLESLKDLEI